MQTKYYYKAVELWKGANAPLSYKIACDWFENAGFDF